MPVTVTVYVPWEPLQEIVDEELLEGASVMFVLLNEHESWEEDVVTCRASVPAKPFRLVKVIVETPDPPPFSVMLDGFDATSKSEPVQMFVLVIA